MKPDQLHRVYLFDVKGERPPKLAFSHEERKQANTFVREWQKDPGDRAAVVWPIGAKAPHGATKVHRSGTR